MNYMLVCAYAKTCPIQQSYPKYESHPWMFVTVRPNIVEAEWRRKKKNKEKKKKKIGRKNLGRNYKTSRPTDGMPNNKHFLK